MLYLINMFHTPEPFLDISDAQLHLKFYEHQTPNLSLQNSLNVLKCELQHDVALSMQSDL